MVMVPAGEREISPYSQFTPLSLSHILLLSPSSKVYMPYCSTIYDRTEKVGTKGSPFKVINPIVFITSFMEVERRYSPPSHFLNKDAIVLAIAQRLFPVISLLDHVKKFSETNVGPLGRVE